MLRRLSTVPLLLLMVALMVAAGGCLASTMRVEQSLSTTFGDLATVKTLEVTTHTGDVILRGTFGDSATASDKILRTAALTNPANATSKGTATIELDRTSGLSEEELKVKLEGMPYPASCRLMADGRELTLFSTTENGRLEFKLTRRVAVANGKRPGS